MQTISPKDREILRELAAHKVSLAHDTRNAEILKMWQNQAKGVRDTPTVRLLFSNFTHEVIGNRLRCEGDDARRLEWSLLSSMVGRDLFNDDTPISDTFDVGLFTHVTPFRSNANLHHAEGSMGFHIEPITDDIETDIEMFLGGHFGADPDGTKAFCAYADEIFGDIPKSF